MNQTRLYISKLKFNLVNIFFFIFRKLVCVKLYQIILFLYVDNFSKCLLSGNRFLKYVGFIYKFLGYYICILINFILI